MKSSMKLKCFLSKSLAVMTIAVLSMTPFGWAEVSQAAFDQLMKANKELVETVSKLTVKVDTLEKRVSSTETVAGGMVAATQTVAPQVEAEHGLLLSKGGNVYMDGFIDTSFNWNMDSPGTGPQTGPLPAGNNATGNSTLRSFDREADTFDLNNAQINFYRPAPENGGVGFRTEFMYGTDAQVADSAGFDTADEFAIQEAF
ncbi:MAG TPA: outer membrane beta-barrel protein, partial [Candidatus Omnitrophota bacterium]|nr:outer membrane beta-barrel protein [Candidatus Omnitrophota bacterium]